MYFETKLDGYRRNLQGTMIVGDTFNPTSDPYQPGDDVQIYVSETDPDSDHHGKEGIITDILQDNLGDETGRELDSYSYRIETNGEEIDVWSRHRDLVPVSQ